MKGIIVLVIALACFVGMIVLIFRYVRKINRRKIELHQNLALKLNLEHTTQRYLATKLNRMEGDRHGCAFTIYEKIVGSGKNQTLYTYMAFEPTPFNFEFSISKENFLNRIGKVFSGKDIEFDNPEFDKTFFLKSKSEDQFRALFDYRIQQLLTETAPSLRGWITNTETTFGYSMAGGLIKEQHVAEIEKVLAFMDALIKNRR